SATEFRSPRASTYAAVPGGNRRLASAQRQRRIRRIRSSGGNWGQCLPLRRADARSREALGFGPAPPGDQHPPHLPPTSAMNSSYLRDYLVSTLRRALRPIARLLIGAGIRFDEFAHLARGVYVETAIRDGTGTPGMPSRAGNSRNSGNSRTAGHTRRSSAITN